MKTFASRFVIGILRQSHYANADRSVQQSEPLRENLRRVLTSGAPAYQSDANGVFEMLCRRFACHALQKDHIG